MLKDLLLQIYSDSFRKGLTQRNDPPPFDSFLIMFLQSLVDTRGWGLSGWNRKDYLNSFFSTSIKLLETEHQRIKDKEMGRVPLILNYVFFCFILTSSQLLSVYHNAIFISCFVLLNFIPKNVGNLRCLYLLIHNNKCLTFFLYLFYVHCWQELEIAFGIALLVASVLLLCNCCRSDWHRWRNVTRCLGPGNRWEEHCISSFSGQSTPSPSHVVELNK